jgi:hypothetical protein
MDGVFMPGVHDGQFKKAMAEILRRFEAQTLDVLEAACAAARSHLTRVGRNLRSTVKFFLTKASSRPIVLF